MASTKRKTVSASLGGLLFLSGLFFLNFTSRVIFSPLLPAIEKEMGIDHAQSGSLFLFISIGYFVSILSSGFVSGRLGHKKTIVLSTILLGCTLFFIQFCATFFLLRCLLFVLGMGAGLYFPSGIATIVKIVEPASWARGLAVHELAPNIAFVVAPLISALFLSYLSWQTGVGLFGFLLLFFGILYGLSSQGSNSYGKVPDFQSSFALIRTTQFWELLVLFSFAICSTLGIYSMTPLYLVNDHGMDQEHANLLLSLSRAAAIFMPLLGGWLGDRIGNRLLMISVLMLSGILTIFLALSSSGVVLVGCIVLQSMVAVCFFPSGFAVLSALGEKEYGNLAITLCLPLAFLFGAGVMPTLIGFTGDHYSISTGFLLAGVSMFFAAGVSFLLTYKKK